MTNENGVKVLTDMVADFVAHIGKKLPDDVVAKLEERDMPPQASAATAYHAPPGASAVNATALSAK